MENEKRYFIVQNDASKAVGINQLFAGTWKECAEAVVFYGPFCDAHGAVQIWPESAMDRLLNDVLQAMREPEPVQIPRKTASA